ncbi:hypothetical protein GFL91_20505 [Rhizobium leguminosarum bv. viciae]|uniref:Uncharacterized protein n=1 Tax=Rhizobium leguminosarum bv. viciae TaxID=387 RepID=A0A8I2KK95_RHILV|nr:hypothetical protein [Rhizobium leguminosarum]NKM47310.1 hypothetical protein [Rhizobium leguminosarum bv. viciae]
MLTQYERHVRALPAFGIGCPLPEHDAEKCARFSDDIMLYFFDLDQDSDFRPIGPKIILI